MERHFACTACGKCCRGWLPLTLADALVHAHRFPLALIWTPVRQGARAFDLTARLGTSIRLRDRRTIAIGIVPTAYVPPSMSCPALTDEGLCAIQAEKPQRCRTMPFFPWRDEADQGDLLVPRKDWACDVSASAPVAYRDKAILDRADFDRERGELVRQAPQIKAYGDWMLSHVPPLQDDLAKIALKPAGGHLVVNFSTLLARLKEVDKADFARRQVPVLEDFAARTERLPDLADYHRRYRDCARELGFLLPPS